jgi:hypothetical protein
MPPAAQASSGVGSLVASIKQHKKFRQLASYSVQCLCKVITPPHIGWERNLKVSPESRERRAIRLGGAPRRGRRGPSRAGTISQLFCSSRRKL